MNTASQVDGLTHAQIQSLVISTLEDYKAHDIKVIDVRGQSPLTDTMVIASGTSTRHVKSMAENLAVRAKQQGCPPLGVEGDRESEWVLVDLNDVIVHIMLPQARAFYNLEKLWEASETQRSKTTQPV